MKKRNEQFKEIIWTDISIVRDNYRILSLINRYAVFMRPLCLQSAFIIILMLQVRALVVEYEPKSFPCVWVQRRENLSVAREKKVDAISKLSRAGKCLERYTP